MKLIQITGHIGSDAKIYSQNGNETVRFAVAVTEKYKTNGETKEKTDWFSVFTSQKSLVPYLKKGTKVFVLGKLNLAIRRNEQSQQHEADLSINSLTIELLSAQNRDQSTAQGQPAASGPIPGDESDDLPF
ncbi:single-stranded DNA-binding protein [Dyadobacter sp. CY323]|uniref:single-stranded DNA-binding protein n=1 Tax=Dyadobacter sp. CY323 TaxID=2907302 RepID=UPI001F302D8A|nr:single-stranded DNA-binding protein [Dyadobacter sp. CY323]MCE6987467.1 single-stranded DNA-binding protein [Dyadobacter sp. CY323]